MSQCLFYGYYSALPGGCQGTRQCVFYQEARGFLPSAAAPLRATRAGRIPRDSFTAVEQVAKFVLRRWYDDILELGQITCVARGWRKPLPLGEVSPKVTERASPFFKSRRTAIGRFFVSAMLSPCLHFSVSVLALSGAYAPALPRGEPLAKP